MKNGMKSMDMLAHVIECDGESRLSKDARCEFDDITDNEREMIIKYVFEEQRRRMSGGER